MRDNCAHEKDMFSHPQFVILYVCIYTIYIYMCLRICAYDRRVHKMWCNVMVCTVWINNDTWGYNIEQWIHNPWHVTICSLMNWLFNAKLSHTAHRTPTVLLLNGKWQRKRKIIKRSKMKWERYREYDLNYWPIDHVHWRSAFEPNYSILISLET